MYLDHRLRFAVLNVATTTQRTTFVVLVVFSFSSSYNRFALRCFLLIAVGSLQLYMYTTGMPNTRGPIVLVW